MERVSWVCDVALEDHEWVSELTISRQETEVLVALNFDIGGSLRCPVENAVGFRLQHDLIKDSQTTAQKVAKYNEVKDQAIEATFTLSFGWSHTAKRAYWDQ